MVSTLTRAYDTYDRCGWFRRKDTARSLPALSKACACLDLTVDISSETHHTLILKETIH